MHSLILRLVLFWRATRYKLMDRHAPKRFVLAEVPYFAQWESRELVAKILRGDVQAQDDPRWRNSGAKSRTEYASWSWAGCGMACFKMLLAHRNGAVVPLVDLGKKCTAYGGYDMPLETSIGLQYGPFVEFAQRAYDVPSKSVAVLTQAQIVHELALGNYVMASVNAMIRNPQSVPASKGGHLVLVVGYDLGEKEFYIHNPSGGSVGSEVYAPVSFRSFRRFFSNRGIVVSGKGVV